MRKILAILLLLSPFVLSAQFRIVGTGLFTTINDSTYRAKIDFRPDLTGNSYNPTQLNDSMYVITQRGQFYRLDSFYNQTFSSAFIIVVERGGNWGAPVGQVMVFQNNKSIAAPQTVYAVNGATAAMQEGVDTWNSKLIKDLIDSTSLWNEAYDSIIDSAKFTGDNVKTINLYQRDGSAITASFKEQDIFVDTAGSNSARIRLTGTDIEQVTGTVVATDTVFVQMPWDGGSVIGIITRTIIPQGVTLQGNGLINITETAANPGGTINIDASIPTGYITSGMIAPGVIDSVTSISVVDATTQDTAYVIVNSLADLQLPFDGNSVIANISSGAGIKNAVYLTVNGQSVLVQGGGAMSMSANDDGDILTITSATNVVIQQITGVGKAYAVVDGITTLNLPWDGNSILAVTEEFVSNDVTLTINDTTVTFKVGVTDGDKFHITVAGDTWTIDDEVVSWSKLTQAVRDSINAAKFVMPVDSLTFNPNDIAPQLRELKWDNNSGTLALGSGFPGDTVTLQIGQETFYPNVINKTASLLKKGQVVMADPTTTVQGDHIRVVPADGGGVYPSKLVMGVLPNDLEVDSLGLVTWFGYVENIKEADIVQTGITLAAGDILYLSASQPGKYTNVEPSPPAIRVAVALLVRRQNANNLTLLVRPWLNEDLAELNDVKVDSVIHNQVLRYDTAAGYWRTSATAGIVAGDTIAMLAPYFDKRDTVPVVNGGTGLTNFGGPGRVPYSTGATGTGLQFDTTFFVDPTNRNFIWGGGARNGSDNINIGTSNITARQNNGIGNINIGTNAGNNLSSNAFYNINIGNSAGINLTTGDENTLLGISAGSELTTGIKNTYLGVAAGRFNSVGSYNIAIGADIYAPKDSADKTLTIGNLLFGVNMDSIGKAIPVNGKVGVKVASPTRDLHVAGEIRVTDLDAGVTPTQVVGADANGVFDAISLGTGITLSGGTLSGTDTTSLSNRINLKLNIADTATMLTPYLRKADTTAMLTNYQRKITLTTSGTEGAATFSNNTLNIPNYADTSIYREDGTLSANRTVNLDGKTLTFTKAAASSSEYVRIGDKVIRATNASNPSTIYETTIDPFGIQQSTGTLDSRIDLLSGEVLLKSEAAINAGGSTSDMQIDATGKVKFRVTNNGAADSLFGRNSSGELTAVVNNLDSKLNATDTASLSNRINLKLNTSDTTAMLAPYLREADTLSLSNRINATGAVYVSIVIYAPDDTVTTGINSKDFFIVPLSLNGYCIEGFTTKALAGTGSADVQVRLNTTNYSAITVSGTTASNQDTNISISTGNVIRGNVDNISGTLIGLGMTVELRKTCN